MVTSAMHLAMRCVARDFACGNPQVKPNSQNGRPSEDEWPLAGSGEKNYAQTLNPGTKEKSPKCKNLCRIAGRNEAEQFQSLGG